MAPGARLSLCVTLLLGLGGSAIMGAPVFTRDVPADWRFVTGGRIRFAPALAEDGTVYCASDDRLLRAVSPEGRELWRARLPGRPAASPLVQSDGSICLVTTDGSLLCLGPNGRERWSRALPAAAVAAPAAGANGGLYVPLEGGVLEALDYRGRERWSFQFKAEIAASPAVSADGTIYLSTADRLFHALESEGTQRWAVALPGNGGSPAVGRDGTVYVSTFGIHALSPDGRLLWDFPVASPTTDPVIASEGAPAGRELVIAGSRNGRLHVVDGAGTRVEEIELGGSIAAAPAVRPDGVVVVASNAGLCGVRPGRSEPVPVVRAKEAFGPPVLARGGMALAGSEDWVLYACSFSDEAARPASVTEPQESSWPQPRHDAAQSGSAAAAAGGESASYAILRELVALPLPLAREQVLDAIRGHLRGVRYLPLTAAEMEGLLASVSREGGWAVEHVAESPGSSDPRLRFEACALLGELGTRTARLALLDMMEKESRGEVQLMAAEALGRVGYDPDGRSALALRALAERRRDDVGLLLVVVRALAEVSRVVGPSLGLGDAPLEAGAPAEEGNVASRPAWQALVSIATGPYPERVRAAARGALDSLVDEVRRY